MLTCQKSRSSNRLLHSAKRFGEFETHSDSMEINRGCDDPMLDGVWQDVILFVRRQNHYKYYSSITTTRDVSFSLILFYL